MKQKDIMLFIVIGVFSAIFAFVISSFFINSPEARQQTAEVVDPITAEFAEPDERYFNERSVNPTQIIEIQDNSNQTPFN